MTNRAHANSIIDLENLLSRATDGKKQDALVKPDRGDWTARCQLRLDVLAPVRDRFDPSVRFFDHATDSLKIAAIFSSDKVLMPSLETVLMIGKIFPLRSTPPVAVSDSAAVSKAGSAIVTASSSLRVCSGRPDHLFS